MEKNDFQSAHEAGQATKVVSHDVQGIEHIQVPKSCELKSMENFMPAPQRIIASPIFSDLDGFADYIKEFTVDGSRIFVDEENLSFTTVFDFHTKEQPAWGDHKATMQLATAHEWAKFCKFDEKVMDAKEFAEFIEDNLAFISAEDMTSADLLTMAQTFKVNFKGELDVVDTLQSGLRKLVVKDDSVLNGKNSGGVSMAFPEKLNLKLRFFKNHDTYPIEVFLRYRCTKESVVFFIKIPDQVGLVEEAFDSVIEKVAEKTGLTTLKGRQNSRR